MGEPKPKTPSKQGNYEIGHKKPPVDKRWVAGQSGNMRGRPKGTVSVTKYIRQFLEENGDEMATKLAKAIVLQAAKGNAGAIKAVLDRIDGPVKEETNLNATILVKYDSPRQVDTDEDHDGDGSEADT